MVTNKKYRFNVLNNNNELLGKVNGTSEDEAYKIAVKRFGGDIQLQLESYIKPKRIYVAKLQRDQRKAQSRREESMQGVIVAPWMM